MPDKPKNKVTSPSSPIFAEQCIGKTSFSGNKSSVLRTWIFHFAGVAHTGDQHFALGKVNHNRAIAIGAVPIRLALEVRGVKDLPDFFVVRIVVLGTMNKDRPKRLCRVFGVHLYWQIVFRIRTHMEV